MSKDAFWANDLENCRFMFFVDGAKDCYDCNNIGNPEFCYESATADNSYNCLFTINCWKCTFGFYSNNCHSSNNFFGCMAIKHGEYSILNKKYLKTEYEKLKEKIIEHMKKSGEWGEFLSASVSPYSYNETLNVDFFPMVKVEAINRGFGWKEEHKRNYNITLSKDKIPETISKVNEDILNEVIECAHQSSCDHKCTNAFRVVERELKFYKKMDIPIPNLCPNCRYYERIKQRIPVKLWQRQCMCDKENHDHNEKCNVEFETSYAPDRPEIIYCEKCYQQEVY